MSAHQPTGERRLRRRHGLADVRGNLLFSYECRILNLSERGMAVRTSTALAPGRSYAIKIQHDGRQIPLSGTVAWCRLQGTERNARGEPVPVYSAGIELESALSARASEILPLLRERGVVYLEHRLQGHLVPRRGTGSGTEAASVTVRELSREGMVIEAPLFPEKDDLLDLRVQLHDEDSLVATLRATGVRSLGERQGVPWAEISASFAEMGPKDRVRLERLLHEELGLGEPSEG